LQRAIGNLWRWLEKPWLLLTCGVLSLILTAGALLLPQLPGQLNDEPATAARWLLTTSQAYGFWGNAWRTLGLFNVLHSTLLYLLMALLTLMGAVQLADQLGMLRQFARLASLLDRPLTAVGEPLPIAPLRPVYRRRTVAESDAFTVSKELDAQLTTRFAVVQHGTMIATQRDSPQPVDAGAQRQRSDSQKSADFSAEVDRVTALHPTPSAAEYRLLAMRNRAALYLRPLLPVGLLIALAGIWSAIVFGWHVAAPALAPGASYRSVNHGLELVYPSPRITDTTPVPELSVRMAGRLLTYTVPSALRFRLAGASARVQPDAPALWIVGEDDEPLFALPGASEQVSAAGLIFPAPGSEESLLLPGLAAGLRVVRTAGMPASFVLELYRSTDVEPVVRTEISGAEPVRVPLGNGQAIRVLPLPSLQIDVRHLPGLWLAWLGLLLAALGLAGWVRRPTYLLAQTGPWPSGFASGDRAVVVMQSSSPYALDVLGPAPPSPPVPERPVPASSGPTTST
jgi:hypothetical protein